MGNMCDGSDREKDIETTDSSKPSLEWETTLPPHLKASLYHGKVLLSQATTGSTRETHSWSSLSAATSTIANQSRSTPLTQWRHWIESPRVGVLVV